VQWKVGLCRKACSNCIVVWMLVCTKGSMLKETRFYFGCVFVHTVVVHTAISKANYYSNGWIYKLPRCIILFYNWWGRIYVISGWMYDSSTYVCEVEKWVTRFTTSRYYQLFHYWNKYYLIMWYTRLEQSINEWNVFFFFSTLSSFNNA